jgi:hypothetical protein
MRRRRFLRNIGIAGAGISFPSYFNIIQSGCRSNEIGNELKSDIVIIGGGLGGCAAALAACQQGASVILTEPTDWMGGQVSQQGVPPDEHSWIESSGRTASYARFRTMIREYYRNNYPLNQVARDTEYLNPGNGMVSRLCHEPKVALAVLQKMLDPAIKSEKLKILLHTTPVKAYVGQDHINAVECLDKNLGKHILLHGIFFIDASEEGDLLPLSGTEYVIGAESQDRTGEPHAPEMEDPGNIQALTWCFAIDHLEGEDHVIERPEMYEFWKEHVPDLNPPWSGKLLSLAYSNPRTLEPKNLSFIPPGKHSPAPNTPSLNLWLYRRIIDRMNFIPGTFPSDITLVNWPQNDYMLGNITDVTDKIRKENLFQAKQLSLSLLYWLQTEAPQPDGKQGWKGLRLRKDIFETSDGLAKYPYIRESRRIMAELTIKEQDLTLEERQKVSKIRDKQVLATPFNDSVGIGYYHLDLHPSTGGDNYIDTASVPFQIPLGAMIPKRMENLIPGCKNIGTTHISNGCYRLHPVEWSIGEAAGHLCAYALRRQISPRAIRNTRKYLQDFQKLLVNYGMELEWSQLK